MYNEVAQIEIGESNESECYIKDDIEQCSGKLCAGYRGHQSQTKTGI